MRHLKGNILAIAAAGIASAVIIAGLAVNVASGAPSDVVTGPTPNATAVGNPPASPINPPNTAAPPSTAPSTGGNDLGVNNGPSATGAQAGAANLPTAGFGPGNDTGAGSLPVVLALLGVAGFVLVTAGATFSRKRGG